MLANGKGVHCEVESEGSRRQKPAPTNRNYIRRIVVGDAAIQAKARYCTEQRDVNIEARWAESAYTYPERSDDNQAAVRASAQAETYVRIKNNKTVSSEVSRSHSKPETSLLKEEDSQKEEGLNVRKANQLEGLWSKPEQPKHIRELLNLMISRKLKVKMRGVEPDHASDKDYRL